MTADWWIQWERGFSFVFPRVQFSGCQGRLDPRKKPHLTSSMVRFSGCLALPSLCFTHDILGSEIMSDGPVFRVLGGFLNSAPDFIFSCHKFLNINHCGRNDFMRSSLLFMPWIWRDQVMKRRGGNRFLLKNLRVRCGSQAQVVYLRAFLSAFFPFLFLLNTGKMFPLCFCMWPLISQSNGDNLFIRITYHHLEKMDVPY